jgi:hypothetical protein
MHRRVRFPKPVATLIAISTFDGDGMSNHQKALH